MVQALPSVSGWQLLLAMLLRMSTCKQSTVTPEHASAQTIGYTEGVQCFTAEVACVSARFSVNHHLNHNVRWYRWLLIATSDNFAFMQVSIVGCIKILWQMLTVADRAKSVAVPLLHSTLV